MKTKRNIFSTVVAFVMCAVIFAGFAPTQIQAAPSRDLPLVISAEALQENRDGISNIEFALLHNGVVVDRQTTSVPGSVRFTSEFRVSDIPNLELQLVSSGGWVSEDISPAVNVPVADFENWGGGRRIFIGVFTPASAQAPEPPAQPPDSGMLQFTIGSVTYVNGGTSNTLEAAPFLSEDGRTMVPVRAIVEGLGSTDVGFNTATQEVTFSLNGQQFALTIGQQLAGNNGESMGAPVIVAGRTFVPARFVSESVGAQVSWDGATQTVSISK